MGYILLPLLTAALIGAAVYAHLRLPFHTTGSRQLWIARAVLVLLGIGFGWAVTTTYVPVEGVQQVWAFLSSFGVVHVPAAFILFIKRQRKMQA